MDGRPIRCNILDIKKTQNKLKHLFNVGNPVMKLQLIIKIRHKFIEKKQTMAGNNG